MVYTQTYLGLDHDEHLILNLNMFEYLRTYFSMVYTQTYLRLDHDEHLILKLNMFEYLRTDSIPHQKREFLNFPRL